MLHLQSVRYDLHQSIKKTLNYKIVYLDEHVTILLKYLQRMPEARKYIFRVTKEHLDTCVVRIVTHCGH